MPLTESYKNRLKSLAGVKFLTENINLTANSGRSDAETLSWYVEQYLLKLGGDILTQLDNSIKSNQNSTLILSKSSTKISSNSLIISIMIEKTNPDGTKQEDEFMLTLSVNIDTDSNTVASITYKSITNKVNLNSKHSDADLEKFKAEVVDNIINSVAIIEKSQES